jgi:hypothetical protein
MSPLLVLQACAEARALLFRTAEYETLGEAIAPLLVYAHDHDLVDRVGAEGVLAIIRDAFGDDWVEL